MHARCALLAAFTLLVACSPGAPAQRPPAARPAPGAILTDLAQWDTADRGDRRAAADWVGKSLPDFQLQRMETFTVGEHVHEIAVFRHPRTGLEFSLVPVGAFDMGSNAIPNSDPVHPVTLTNPFLLCRTEVPQGTWDSVMGAQRAAVRGPADVPVTSITWAEATQFCVATDLELPTEAQWEWASLGGVASRWCFGDDEARVGDYAWYADNSGGRARPVGKKYPNQFGIYDMEGNVAEYCSDWYGIYPSGPVIDPAGVTIPMYHAARGGTWIAPRAITEPRGRLRMNPAESGNVVGFRPAKTLHTQ